jgi:hypothetical protein
MLAEYNGSNALQRRFVFDDEGQPIVWYEGTGTTNRRFLGAARIPGEFRGHREFRGHNTNLTGAADAG